MYKNLYLEENIFTPAEYHSTLLIQDFDPTVKKKKKKFFVLAFYLGNQTSLLKQWVHL